jgi:amidophosphoribosyltransferase
VDEIRDHLTVDSLGYLSLEGTLEAAGGDPARFCHACFSGDYPTPVSGRAKNAKEPALID